MSGTMKTHYIFINFYICIYTYISMLTTKAQSRAEIVRLRQHGSNKTLDAKNKIKGKRKNTSIVSRNVHEYGERV